jgi:flagellar basal-body rod modification protein FlgD
MSITIPVVSQPGILLPPAKASLAKAMAAATSNSAGTSTDTSSTSPSNLGSTFLNLLATELKNQDPTAPVDSTAMVGQMISLNQLDQLIAINQTLTGTTASTATTTPVSPTAHSVTKPAALDPAAALASAQAALPFDPNTLMPIATSTGNSTSIAGAK